MIQIEINRWTIMQLEKAIDKHNKEENYSKHEYVEIINWLLDKYVFSKQKEQGK